MPFDGRSSQGSFAMPRKPKPAPERVGSDDGRKTLETAPHLKDPRIHNARIAALCLHHGVRELWTADRDFSMFPRLKTRNPLVKKWTRPGAANSAAIMPDTPQPSLQDLAIGDDFLKSSDAHNTRAGFILANGANSAHSCTMKIIEDVRKYASV